MFLKTVRWLTRTPLLAVALAVLTCGSATAQDSQQPGDPPPRADDVGGQEPTVRLGRSAVDDGLSPDERTDVSVQSASAGSQVDPKADADATRAPLRESQPAVGTPQPAADGTLVPIPDALESGPVAIEAASFKGVTPGVTTMDEVEKAWGAPKEISKQNSSMMQLFAVEPFERVEVSYFEDRVASVVIRLAQAFPANTVAQQLELASIRPVLVSNELGEILGQVYPERGVLFAFEPSETPGRPSMRVGQIILEPISAEPFVLRAETNLDTRCDLSLRDIEQALKLRPTHARAHWLHARVLLALSKYDRAETASAEAVRLEPENARYRVTRAQILGLVGRLADATQEAQRAVETSQRRPHVKARALCLLGDLAGSGSKPDYKRAVQYHMEAVQVADPLAADRHPAIRLAAKEVLVDAHLGAAHDIAWGTWKQKEVAVGKWLEQAEAFAEDLVEREGRNEELRFRVSTRALAACVGVRGELDPSQWANRAVETGKQLLAATDDPLRKARLQWDLGMALYDALQIYQMRQDHDAALKYGEWAIEYLEQGEQEQRSATSNYLLGRLYFRLGAIHAIRDENHRAAAIWFDKALPLLEEPLSDEAVADRGRRGETFVSMGVSYWEAGQRDKAVETTQHGLELMVQAVKQGTLDESALGVPYNNLASMHRQLGRDGKADEFEEMATKLRGTKLQ